LVHRGNAFIKDKRFAEALNSYDKALATSPDHVAALTDRGVALAELDRFDEALAAHERALHIEPHVVAGHVNRGNALLKLTRMEEALESYTKALSMDPANVDANFNAALTRLCIGDFAEGWKQYECRWEKKEFAEQRRGFLQPMWRGEKDLKGKTVLLLAEQGLGDTIQFVRYAPLVAALGAKVIAGVPASLKALVSSVPGVSQVLTDGEPVPAFDLQCPMLSLPLAFETEIATIPANIPYLRPDRGRVAKWNAKLPDNGRLRAGVCWAGNSKHQNDRNRSLPLERLAPVLSAPGVDFVSVQKEVTESDAALLRDHGVVQLGQEFADFSDTAAVVAMLDLIVAVDTSVAHLAGAMGKVVALLVPFSPDWRWLLDRTDSPWYPTMRLFRQNAVGDWSSPIERLRKELADAACRPAGSQ
jgi:hypothetical protein